MIKASTDKDTICSAALNDLPVHSAGIAYFAKSTVASDIIVESTVDPLEAVRLAGAQLDDAFISMAADVVEEEDAEPISLTVESLQLKGLLYQGEIYRLIESFSISHRLQAFCLGQTLTEQKTAYLITRSPERFAVWVNIRSLPDQRCCSDFSSDRNLS